MTNLQKQVFETSFNHLGLALTEAFESAQNKKDKKNMKKIGGYIKSLKQMFTYTNMLETELIIEKQKNEENSTLRWQQIREKSVAKKNDR